MAASHFQVEGYPAEIDSRLSDWALWTTRSGKIADGSNADRACEFSSRFLEDIALVKQLNLNSYRTSLNWPALLPDRPGPGKRKLNSQAVQYYKRLFFTLKEEGITTFLTLFHFCLPTWIADDGGWTGRMAADEFAYFSELAAGQFGEYVDYWITINEPVAYAYQSFVSGLWPPGTSRNYDGAFATVRYMLEGHARAYQAIKEQSADTPVSFSNHWRPFFPENPLNPLDQMVIYFRDNIFNHIFPRSIEAGGLELPAVVARLGDLKRLNGEIAGLKGSMDYLAVNYYTRELSRFVFGWPVDPFGIKSSKADFDTNSLGWETYPQGLFDVLTRAIAPYKTGIDGKSRPVIITENGYAETYAADLSEGDWSIADKQRTAYLKLHLQSLHRAIMAGVNVIGYLHWSLTDNFEWAEGLSPRFGLVRVAYPTQTRTFRESARLFSQVAKTNVLDSREV
ncbi:MAG: family 1 glycosylhydrolase [Candidatus Obscuribacterales bacterium]|nr:family 1 glycosylhydrolase [Candidatus Obscuribacterales bacterium]